MTNTAARVSGVCGILFAVLFFLALILPKSPGGGYEAKDIAEFVGKDNRPMAILAAVLWVVAAACLLRLFAGLHQRIEDVNPGSYGGKAMWGSAIVASAAIAIGGVTWMTVPISLALGDAPAVAPEVTYAFGQLGALILLVGGGVMLASALVGLVAGGRAAFPGWFIVASWIGIVAGLATFLWMPIFLLLLWSILAGLVQFTAPARTAA